MSADAAMSACSRLGRQRAGTFLTGDLSRPQDAADAGLKRPHRSGRRRVKQHGRRLGTNRLASGHANGRNEAPGKNPRLWKFNDSPNIAPFTQILNASNHVMQYLFALLVQRC